jgi:hypothetical protein
VRDINEFVAEIDKLPFYKRLAFVKQVNETSFHQINYYTTSLSYRGYLVDVDEKAVQCNEGGTLCIPLAARLGRAVLRRSWYRRSVAL